MNNQKGIWSGAAASGAGYAVFILTMMNLLNYLDRIIPSVVKDLFKRDLKLTDAQTSLPITGFVIVYMLTSPIFGSLADRWSRKVLIALGVALWSLATGAAALAVGFWSFLLARAFVGIGEAAYATISPALLNHHNFLRGDTRGFGAGVRAGWIFRGRVRVAGGISDLRFARSGSGRARTHDPRSRPRALRYGRLNISATLEAGARSIAEKSRVCTGGGGIRSSDVCQWSAGGLVSNVSATATRDVRESVRNVCGRICGAGRLAGHGAGRVVCGHLEALDPSTVSGALWLVDGADYGVCVFGAEGQQHDGGDHDAVRRAIFPMVLQWAD
jgi:hypothetical protein